jgi:hypothetical protein
MGCHGVIDQSTKRDRSPYQISSAIGTLSYMNHLNILTDSEIKSISYALGFDPNKAVGQCKGTRAADTTALFRMNKAEYLNTVGDLFGSPESVADGFPPDSDGRQFANNAADLATISNAQAEQYVVAAEKVVDDVWTNRKSLIMSCDPAKTAPATCAGTIIDNWGPRILRRPLVQAERDKLLAMVTVTSGVAPTVFESGIQTAIKALLISPDFVYRVVKASPGQIHTLDNYELATRLAYFLWDSTVDAELLAQAKAGSLKSNLKAEIKRMLADPKAKRLTDTFASRWLGLGGLAQKAPDAAAYPNYTAALGQEFVQETRTFWENIVSKDLSVEDVLDADYTFVNADLAAFYGLSGITGKQFRQVSLAATPRRGVVSQASILMLTSHSDDSSIVQRGKWILTNLMCDAPPPPPAKVPVSTDGGTSGLTKRQLVEQHRNNANCYSCHAKMDPLGFGLENFDGIGGFRLTYDGQPVDSAGALPDGTPFTGPAALTSYLGTSGAFNKCAARNLTSYALGRVLEDADDCNVEQVKIKGIDSGGSLSDTIEAIVNSDLFSKVAAQ